ncbi:hypothetical protein ACI5EL_001069 [Escherichia coli]
MVLKKYQMGEERIKRKTEKPKPEKEENRKEKKKRKRKIKNKKKKEDASIFARFSVWWQVFYIRITD